MADQSAGSSEALAPFDMDEVKRWQNRRVCPLIRSLSRVRAC